MENEKIIRKHRKATVAIVSIVALACVALLTACSDSDYVSPANQAENDLVTIVESINERDSAAIKSLLSSYFLANIEDIDSSIDEMLEFIDGEIVSYDEPFGSECGSLEKKRYECKNTMFYNR